MSMRVAIVHDFMTSLGGGEKVVLTLANALGAEIVTTEVDPQVLRHAGFDGVVLSGNWAVHAARRHHPNAYICYTPTRVFYDLRDEWLAGLPILQRPFARVWTRVHRAWNE